MDMGFTERKNMLTKMYEVKLKIQRRVWLYSHCPVLLCYLSETF